MALQTGKNLLVASKVETTFGVRPTVLTGAKQVRLTGGGLGVRRARINSAEITSDGQPRMPRLGSRSVGGSYPSEISPGTFDEWFEAVLRGTWSSGTLIPTIPPVSRSFTIEQYEQDIDITTEFNGCRIVSMTVRLAPDAMATVEFGVMGVNGAPLTTGTSPLYSSPVLTTTDALVATDAAITVGGVAALDYTSCEFTWDLHASVQPMIGTTIPADVYTSNATLEGSITAVRRDAARQSAYLAETEVALVLALAQPSPGTASIAFTLPRIKFVDYTTAIGNDGAMLATIPFVGAKDATKAIQITTTT